MDDAIVSTVNDAMETRRHGILSWANSWSMDDAMNNPIWRRFVHGLFRDAAHGSVVGAMEHAMVLLGSTMMASSMVHDGLTMDDAMVDPTMVHANTTSVEYAMGTHGTCHRMAGGPLHGGMAAWHRSWCRPWIHYKLP